MSVSEAASGFKDIHSHVLWGLDDGAIDFDMSVEMLRIAAQNGTSDIVATPHSNLHFPFLPQEIEHKIAELSNAVAGFPRIHTGCDFHLHFDNIQDCLANPRKFTINHLRYLMVEFPDSPIAQVTGRVFERMQQAGITPVITHPERNTFLMDQPELMQAWVNAGCLIQVTGQSFFGRFGKRAKGAAESLMARGLVHFIASDAHDPEDRTPDLRPAFDHVVAHYGESAAHSLFVTNPAAVLTGDYLNEELRSLAAPKRKWYRFW